MMRPAACFFAYYGYGYRYYYGSRVMCCTNPGKRS